MLVKDKPMPELNFQNRTLYHGDNLEFLRGMNSETVHLIATDPPFNKNRDFHATPDSLAAGARSKTAGVGMKMCMKSGRIASKTTGPRSRASLPARGWLTAMI